MRGSALHRNATVVGMVVVAAALAALLAAGHAWALLLAAPLSLVAGLEASARRHQPAVTQRPAVDLTHTRLDGTLRRIGSPQAPVVELAPVRAARRPAARTVEQPAEGIAPVVPLRPAARDERVLRVNG